jgi:hypothetical protein
MPSVKSKIFNMLMRNRHLFQGKLKKEIFDDNTSIENFRRLCEDGAAKYAKIPTGIEIKEEVINGIKSEWIIPDGSDPEKGNPLCSWGWLCFGFVQ